MNDENIKLTPKQESFCNYYIETGNASEAYRRAYDTEDMKVETINRNACGLLKNNKIAARIEELQKDVRNSSDITKEQILFDLKAIMDAKITDYLDFDGYNITFKDFSTLTEKQIKAIESIKEGKNGIELKLHGKSWTIDRICKMLGFDAPVKNVHTGENGEPIKFEGKINEHKITFEDYEEG